MKGKEVEFTTAPKSKRLDAADAKERSDNDFQIIDTVLSIHNIKENLVSVKNCQFNVEVMIRNGITFVPSLEWPCLACMDGSQW
jgi:hypothetical protein